MPTLIKNGTIVTAADTVQADLLIDGEQIALMGRDLPAEGAQVIDAAGKLLLPGGIDVHTHLELPFGGTVSSDDFFTGHRAAAFGATTTHLDFVIQPVGGSLKQESKSGMPRPGTRLQSTTAFTSPSPTSATT